jgi:hypothetical protein
MTLSFTPGLVYHFMYHGKPRCVRVKHASEFYLHGWDMTVEDWRTFCIADILR